MSNSVVVLYGSVARGDDDDWSDVDILVVGSDADVPNSIAELRMDAKRPINISHYTWAEFQSMHVSGSLFLHHLAAEAKPLYFERSGRAKYEAVIQSLPHYRHADRDLRAFRLGVSDVRRGLSIGLSPLFEMAVLGGIVRHASVLACYLVGSPVFGRSSISQGTTLVGVPELAGCLAKAHRFRIFERGQCPKPEELDRKEAFATVDACESFLKAMEPYVNAYTD